MTDSPIQCSWEGDCFRPVSPFWQGRADKMFVVGQRYAVEARQDRSEATHRHYFAAIREAWENLSDDKREQYPSPEHLRAWALIKAGYRNERIHVCENAAAARRFAAFVKPMDEFALVIAHLDVVKVYTAKSQNYRSMNKAEFAESKEKVLAVLAALIGVTPEDLQKNAGQAA